MHLYDTKRIDIRGNITCGKDVTIDINCLFIGKVVLDDGVIIANNCVIKDSHIKKNSVVHPFSFLDGAVIGESNSIGPYARIRPETSTDHKVSIGNFVEIKKTNLASESKVNHLSYLGDSKVGKRVNIGAGVISCNYDGVNKHQTIIDDDCFIGSGSQLVAPIHIEKNCLIGAGTTLSKNTKANSLNLTRAKLKTHPLKQRN